jgi:folate-binding protein YgfZ
LRDAFKDLPELDAATLETLRIEAGLPKWGADFDETTLALEIPDGMQIRVDQGCYVGQEVVARIVHRGHVNRYLRGIQLVGETLPSPGEPIQSGSVEVGQITSAALSPRRGAVALGYVRREIEPGTQVRVNDIPATVLELPFAAA